MWVGTEGEYNVLVMELLGPSLKDLFETCSQRFSLKTSWLLALQLLEILKQLKLKGFVHRDINPSNLCMGSGA